MTPAELARWGADYRRRLDHKIALDKIRTDGANMRKSSADLRRAEEGLSLRCLKTRVRLARADAMAGRKPFPVALAARWNRIHGEVTATTPSDEVALVPRWRAHVDAEARRLGVTIAWTATAMNAYAVASRKEIEISPIVSAFSYATARHELGHVARPCQPSHRRVTSDAALKKTVCVRCELAAWCWAQEDAQPGWTARMQECLAQSLPTYAEYATKAERQEIEELVSGIGFRRAQLARIRRTA